MAEKKLVVFDVEMSNEVKRFSISGEMELETDKDCNNEEFQYPSFCSLIAKQIVDGKEVDYEPTGTTWAGRKYVVADMIQDYVAKNIHGSNIYTTIYVDPELQAVIDLYVNADQIAITVNNKGVPKHILGNNMFYLFELVLVTNEFIYYACYDDVIMLRTDDRTVVSDNYFASVGYFDSVEKIRTGKETLIWGELPTE